MGDKEEKEKKEWDPIVSRVNLIDPSQIKVDITKSKGIREIDLSESKELLIGKTIKNIKAWQNNVGELLVVITTKEPFQVVNAPEGTMTDKYAIFVSKEEESESDG